MKHKVILALLFLLFCLPPVWAQDEPVTEDTTAVDSAAILPAPVFELEAVDKSNDHGHAVTLSWELSADDGSGKNNVLMYEVFRWFPHLTYKLDSLRYQLDSLRFDRRDGVGDMGQVDDIHKVFREEFLGVAERLPEAYGRYPEDGEWRKIGAVPAGETGFDNIGDKEPESGGYMPDFADYYYRVDAVTADTLIRTASPIAGPVQSYGQWFNTDRKPVLVAVLVFGFLMIMYVTRARRGVDMYVRPIGGIEAVDDAIGRATEMGRPILYVMGLGSAADVATIASFTILGRVAKRVAEYQTDLIVPTYDPIVMSVAQDVVKSAYLDAGRPDAYNEDIVFFVTQSQFAYVAAVNGIMLRELPATNVYMGKFFAESLLLAETGALAGSIQIAGTDEIAQIPFFIVACDYTLIGEELYAASAYLGREPILLGSLKAQDLAKAAFVALAIIGIIAANFGWTGFTEMFRVD